MIEEKKKDFKTDVKTAEESPVQFGFNGRDNLIRNQEEKTNIVIYVGPTIAGLASNNTVFNNGIPSILKEAMEKEPAFKGLVVPLKNLATSIKELQEGAGATHVLYNKVIDYKL